MAHTAQWRVQGRSSVLAALKVLLVVLIVHASAGPSAGPLPSYLSELNIGLRHSPPFLVPNVTSPPCSVRSGCPYASMVWATGTFTAPGALTPASFLVEANLTLQLNLCCGYKFNGSLMRDPNIYDTFLYDLLRSTPFHALSTEEKRGMFPRKRVVIFDTQHPQRRYDGSYTPSDRDIQHGNDGDGDVIVLVSGAVGPGIHRIPLYQQLAASSVIPPNGVRGDFYVDASAGIVNSSNNNAIAVAGAMDMSADIQLRVSNVAIKCKCPHTLLVMPLLRAHPDTLPPVSITGLGSHCGVPRKEEEGRGSTPLGNGGDGENTFPNIIQLASGGWAASFTLEPLLLPATLVQWVVTDTTAAADVVLNVSFYTSIVGRPEDSGKIEYLKARSGYFNIVPDHSYNVTVTVTRGSVIRVADGRFVVRLPFSIDERGVRDSSSPQPHFGVERRLQLSQYTRSSKRLRRALTPLANEERPPYIGYWVRTHGGDSSHGHDQPAPFVEHNPYTEGFARYPLLMGRNIISYYLRDADSVCEPVLLESQEFWAVQAVLLEPSTSPVTVCDDEVSLEAFGVRQLLESMWLRQMPVRLVGGSASGELGRTTGIEAIGEGHFNCTDGELSPCHIRVTGADGRSAVLRMLKRGMARLTWSLSVEVNTSQLLYRGMWKRQGSVEDETVENGSGTFDVFLDPSFARVVSSSGNLAVVEVHSRTVHIVRRLSALPRKVSVTLPMHEHQLAVFPPRPVAEQHHEQDRGDTEEEERDALMRLFGRWIVNAPLALISVDELYTAVLNTSAVPNVGQQLNEGTLQFLAEDPGETLYDELLGTPYISQCPPRVVEYIISVVAVAAPPITPSFVPIYTEDSCVVLKPPREARKDEVIRWDISPCAEATTGKPHFATGQQSRELLEKREVSTAPAVGICGIEVDRWCEVVWQAANTAGTVAQTFSLRRCQRPPQLLFHKPVTKDGGNDPPIDIWTLPSVEWLDTTSNRDVGSQGATASGNYGTEGSDLDGDGGASFNRTTEVNYIERRVVPVAGYSATIHYLFNYTGSQGDYEVEFSYEHDAAHQLHVTQLHFDRRRPDIGSAGVGGKSEVGSDDTDPDDEIAASNAGPLLLRRFVHPPNATVMGGSDRHCVNCNPLTDPETAYWEIEGHRRDYSTDREYDALFSHTNSHVDRQLELRGLGNSSNYPFRYDVRPSLANMKTVAAASPARREAAAEFARRGMCLLRPGNISFLTLSPRGLVNVVGERDVLTCEPRFQFSRHPWFYTKYRYDFTWSCDDNHRVAAGGTKMVVEKHSPTFSTLHYHTSEDAQCSLTVRNMITGTSQAESFVLRRVHPTPMELKFAVLGDNWASGDCSALRKGKHEDFKVHQAAGEASDAHQGPTPRKRAHWIVGKRALLHVDAPANSRTSRWRAVSVVPAEPSSLGTQLLLDSLQIVPFRLPHPLAVSRGAGGSTVAVNNIRVPGMYTFAHDHLDATYPNVCPNVTVTETVYVTHAQVVQRDLVVCGDTASLAAVPLPPAINCSFIAQWEVVSVQVSDAVTLTKGTQIGDIQFGDINSPRTTVRGLPFGIVTVRWAIYATAASNSGVEGQEQRQQQERGAMVDYDTVRLLVLTENLRTSRLITLSSSIEMPITDSTHGWALLETTSQRGPGLMSASGPRLHVGPASRNHTAGAEDNLVRRAAFVKGLPVGLTHLQYDLHASSRLFGPMMGRSCPSIQRKLFTIERVTAFLSVNTTLDHECDAYSGRGALSICLHAEGVNPAGSTDAVALRDKQTSSEVGVRLAAPDVFENAVKDSAERLRAHGCSLPWWVSRSARWFDLRLDGSKRCISLSVKMAGRHLQSKEVSHQLFLAQEHLGVPRACPYGNGDFVPSEVIEGASTWGVGVSGEDSLWSQLRSHPVGRDPDVSTTLLPFLNTATFARENRAMRPMISQLGVADVVASELDISEGGHEDVGQLNGANERMGRGVNKSVNVVFRLDRNNPGRTAGFLYTESPQEKVDQGGSGSTQHEGSILTRCVRGTLRGSDALAYWTEVNHPDDVNGGTAHEWSEYVHHIGNARLTCEPLFVSLAQLLRLPEDTEVTLRRRRSSFIPSKEQRLVPLEVLESQLEALRKEFLLTREGIDITGLRPEVQQALARRRITRSQLSEIERARFEKVQQERPEDPQRLALTSTANKMTREERLVAALRFYKGVTGEDVSAVRVKLPHHSSFTVPHNLFLRTALHKDLMCGTSVSPMSVAPASVVLFSRVELIDEPPTVGASPQAIKQCEVEGRIPPIYVNVSAARFVRGGSFPSENVLLEELPNPNVSVPRYTANVGIAPCLARMRAGMEVKVSPLNRRQLTLQLSPCPFFQMLSSEEYNEQQDSEWLSRRLKHPRLLRITLRDALVQDSHTRGLTTISFVVEVRPTLALLHLRSLPLEGSAFQPDWVSKGRRPLLMCEADMRRKGMELGIELVGDTWDARVGEADKETRESDGYEDQGDDGSNSFVSRNPHNEVDVVNAVSLHRDHEAGRAWDRGEAKRSWRSPQDVAMLNGFSVVEHHSFDSAHHLYLQQGGIYHSHFVSYLFSVVLGDPDNTHRRKFIYRYNKTFVSVRVVPERDSLRDSLVAKGHDGYPADTSVMADHDSFLPPIRPFSTIEEILFAVPGIATECQGCLLADTTFFVAGDLTGLWSFLPPDSRENSQSLQLVSSSLSAPLRIPFDAAASVPREWRFTTLCPSAALEALRTIWQSWERRGVQPFLVLELVVYKVRDVLGGEPPHERRSTAILTSIPMTLTQLLRQHTETSQGGGAISEIVFAVNGSTAERAYGVMAADFIRRGRSQVRSVYEYTRDGSQGGGAYAVNGSVFLKVCIPSVPLSFSGSSGASSEVRLDPQCSIVSFTHSLLLMEVPRTASRYVSYYHILWSIAHYPLLFLHHVGTATLCYGVLPHLPFQRLLLLSGPDDVQMARVGMSVMVFVAAVFICKISEHLWVGMVLALWLLLLLHERKMITGILMAFHVFLWFVMS